MEALGNLVETDEEPTGTTVVDIGTLRTTRR